MAEFESKSPRGNISPRQTGFSSFASSHGPDASTFDFEEFDLANAKALYRKLNYQTSYSRQVGEPPKAQEEFTILKTKKFRELEMSKFFNEISAIYIETWLKINDSDELISTLYFTLREIYTVIKNMDVP